MWILCGDIITAWIFIVSLSSSWNQIQFAPDIENQVGMTHSGQSSFSIHPLQDEFHATFLITMCPLLCYLNTFSAKKMQSVLKMVLGWVVFLLLAGCSVALENSQTLTVSQRCLEDTNTFLWEINQDRPKEYAVLSKCCWLLKGFSYCMSSYSVTWLSQGQWRFRPV